MPEAELLRSEQDFGEPATGHPVLVVDDDPQVLWYVRRTLSDAGFAPVVTADPDEVLRLMEEDRPALVLLDLILPGTDGIELMRDIFGVADAPVVFLSAYGRDEVIAQAFEAGDGWPGPAPT